MNTPFKWTFLDLICTTTMSQLPLLLVNKITPTLALNPILYIGVDFLVNWLYLKLTFYFVCKYELDLRRLSKVYQILENLSSIGSSHFLIGEQIKNCTQCYKTFYDRNLWIFLIR